MAESNLYGIVLMAFVLGEAAVQGGARFRVDLCDAASLGPAVVTFAQQEASRIFREGGATLEWTDGCDEPPRKDPDAARIYVLDDLPKPIRYRLRHDHGKRGLMGYVSTSPGESPGSVIFIARKRIESKIGDVADGNDALGCALGRVAAHELAHRFLQNGHTEDGILKDHFSRRDLLGDGKHLRFSREQMAALARVGAAPER